MRRLGSVLALALLGLLLTAGAAQAQQRSRSIAINPGANLPPTVQAERFAAIGSLAARGWGLRVTGASDRISGRQDGANVLGFTPGLPPGVLGAYEAWGRRMVVRSCRRTRAGRRCRRIVREQILEADVSINSSFAWQQGPQYPASNQVDLESVVIHELGHFAQPRAPHRIGCANSPLVDSLGSGEWWRGPGDWFRRGCPNSPRTPASVGAGVRASRAGAGPYRFRHVIHRLPTVVVTERR